MSEIKSSAWSPSSRELERRALRRKLSRKQAIIAAVSSVFVLGSLAVVLITSPGWEVVKATFFDIEYGKEVFPTVVKGLWINLQLTFFGGIAIGVIALPTIAWLLRDDPANLGQRPDGDIDDSRHSAIAQPATGITLGAAVRSRTFWIILLTFFVIGFAIQSALMHLVPLLTSRGISPMAAAMAQSMMFLAVTTGRLVTGWLMDRFFAPHVALAFLLAPIAGLAMLAMDIPDGLAVVAALMIGLAVGAEVDVLAYLNSRYFGMLHFSRIYGSFYGIYSLSGGVGPLATAMIVERGGYSAAMFTLCGLLVLGCLALLSFPPFPSTSPTTKA